MRMSTVVCLRLSLLDLSVGRFEQKGLLEMELQDTRNSSRSWHRRLRIDVGVGCLLNDDFAVHPGVKGAIVRECSLGVEGVRVLCAVTQYS